MYDLKALIEKLKSRGLNLAEDAARGAVEDVLSWVEEGAKASATPLDDIAAAVLKSYKPQILAELDKIDGAVGA